LGKHIKSHSIIGVQTSGQLYLETTSLKANFPYRTIGAVYKRDVHNRFVSQSVGVQTRPDFLTARGIDVDELEKEDQRRASVLQQIMKPGGDENIAARKSRARADEPERDFQRKLLSIYA